MLVLNIKLLLKIHVDILNYKELFICYILISISMICNADILEFTPWIMNTDTKLFKRQKLSCMHTFISKIVYKGGKMNFN